MIRSEHILFIPSARKGNGTGHLKRCSEWSRGLPVRNFYIPDRDGRFSRDAIESILSPWGGPTLLESDPGPDWDLIVVDNRSTDPEDLPESLRGIPVIALDECGPLRESAEYLIDLLPNTVTKTSPPNRNGLSFLELPPLRQDEPRSIRKKALITFGGEDPADLTGRVLDLLDPPLKEQFDWTVVRGPFYTREISSPGMQILDAPENLRNRLGEFDFVICTFGLTSFEALSAGCEVFLLNPSDYHDRLSEISGFPYLKSALTVRESRLKKTLLSWLESNGDPGRTLGLRNRYIGPGEDLARWLTGLNPSRPGCPVCNTTGNCAVARYEGKSYFRCSSCGMVFMVNMRCPEDLYDESYFFEDYRQQYGKTYLEDFPHIEAMGRKRLRRIQRMKPPGKVLLDVGCAYGPFLSAASADGYRAFGIDISPPAVNYIRDNLPGIEAAASSLEEFRPGTDLPPEQYDVITLWYVIEHFRNPGVLIPHLHGLLSPGGILSLGTPNGKGVSGRFSRESFFLKSPEDHFTIWDRHSTVKILHQAGFDRIRFHITGHHPERFPVRLPFRAFLNRTVLLWISRLFGLGDTFEIFARKKDKLR